MPHATSNPLPGVADEYLHPLSIRSRPAVPYLSAQAHPALHDPKRKMRAPENRCGPDSNAHQVAEDSLVQQIPASAPNASATMDDHAAHLSRVSQPPNVRDS